MTAKTATVFFNELRTSNTMFGATTIRKNDKKVDGEIVSKKGDEIKSTYRLGVPATIKEANTRMPSGLRKYEDELNEVLTVYDMNKEDKDGNRGAFRRIAIDGIIEIRVHGSKFETVWNDENSTWDIVEKN